MESTVPCHDYFDHIMLLTKSIIIETFDKPLEYSNYNVFGDSDLFFLHFSHLGFLFPNRFIKFFFGT